MKECKECMQWLFNGSVLSRQNENLWWASIIVHDKMELCSLCGFQIAVFHLYLMHRLFCYSEHLISDYHEISNDQNAKVEYTIDRFFCIVDIHLLVAILPPSLHFHVSMQTLNIQCWKKIKYNEYDDDILYILHISKYPI